MAEVTEVTGDEVKPYKINIHKRYLDLTKQKLELTRLPHEGAEPKSTAWWEPKSQVEPLIDFWLEKYSWGDFQTTLNDTLPQFRTGIALPGTETPLRLHFVHVRSKRANAIPLLLIPPFPLNSLSLGHLVKDLTDPDGSDDAQPAFHLVIPSLPGLAFSDALPSNVPAVSTTAEALNVLMTRLGYAHYLVSNTGAAASSPAQIDWKLADYLSREYTGSCLGTHFVAPHLKAPTWRTAPLEWAKWNFARLLGRPALGYTVEDIAASKRDIAVQKKVMAAGTMMQPGVLSLREPNTLAYALCDSPTGLLVFILMLLRILGPAKMFSPTEIINFTELAWLPGPEAALRFWASSALVEEPQTQPPKKAAAAKPTMVSKPRVGMTVFLGEEAPASSGTDEEVALGLLPVPAHCSYACPGWARPKYDVVFSARVAGQPGLLAWERPEVLIQGVRGLAAAVVAADTRLTPKSGGEGPATAPLEGVTVTRAEGSGAIESAPGATGAGQAAGANETEGKGKQAAVTGVVATSAEAGQSTPSATAAEASAGKTTANTEAGTSPTAAPGRKLASDPDLSGESPDTIVATPTGAGAS